MPKLLTRLIALLLVPCLIADPALASFPPAASTPAPRCLPATSLFSSQAFIQRVEFQAHPFGPRIRYSINQLLNKPKKFTKPGLWLPLILAGVIGSQVLQAQRAPAPAATAGAPVETHVNALYENTLSVEAADRVLRKTLALVAVIGPQFENDPATPRPAIADLRRFFNFLSSRVTVGNGHFPERVFADYRVRPAAGGEMESRIGLNLPSLEPLIDQAMAGDAAARRMLFSDFSSAGKILGEFDGVPLSRFVDEEVNRLPPGSNSRTALEATQRIIREHAVEMLGDETGVTGTVAGVYPVIINSLQGNQLRLTSLNLELNYPIYHSLVEGMRIPDTQGARFRTFLTAILVKEGGGARELFARPDAGITLANLTGRFTNQSFNGRRFEPDDPAQLNAALQDTAFIETGKILLAQQVYFESVGFDVMLEYLSESGVTIEAIQKIVQANMNAPYSYALASFYRVGVAAGDATGPERLRRIREHVFNEEVGRSLPQARSLIVADAARHGQVLSFDIFSRVTSGRSALNFLMDRAYTGEPQAAGLAHSRSPQAAPDKSTSWLLAALGALALAAGGLLFRWRHSSENKSTPAARKPRHRKGKFSFFLPFILSAAVAQLALNHFFPAAPGVAEAGIGLLGMTWGSRPRPQRMDADTFARQLDAWVRSRGQPIRQYNTSLTYAGLYRNARIWLDDLEFLIHLVNPDVAIDEAEYWDVTLLVLGQWISGDAPDGLGIIWNQARYEIAAEFAALHAKTHVNLLPDQIMALRAEPLYKNRPLAFSPQDLQLLRDKLKARSSVRWSRLQHFVARAFPETLGSPAASLADGGVSPDEPRFRAERARILENALRALHPSHAVVLRKWLADDESTYEQLGRDLNISVDQVHNRLNAGLRTLRRPMYAHRLKDLLILVLVTAAGLTGQLGFNHFFPAVPGVAEAGLGLFGLGVLTAKPGDGGTGSGEKANNSPPQSPARKTMIERVVALLAELGDVLNIPFTPAQNRILQQIQSGERVASVIADRLPLSEERVRVLAAQIVAKLEKERMRRQASESGLSKLPVQTLHLYPRLERALRQRGIRTIEQLLDLNEPALLQIPGVGPYHVEHIKSRLWEMGHRTLAPTPRESVIGPLKSPEFRMPPELVSVVEGHWEELLDFANQASAVIRQEPFQPGDVTALLESPVLRRNIAPLLASALADASSPTALDEIMHFDSTVRQNIYGALVPLSVRALAKASPVIDDRQRAATMLREEQAHLEAAMELIEEPPVSTTPPVELLPGSEQFLEAFSDRAAWMRLPQIVLRASVTGESFTLRPLSYRRFVIYFQGAAIGELRLDLHPQRLSLDWIELNQFRSRGISDAILAWLADIIRGRDIRLELATLDPPILRSMERYFDSLERQVRENWRPVTASELLKLASQRKGSILIRARPKPRFASGFRKFVVWMPWVLPATWAVHYLLSHWAPAAPGVARAGFGLLTPFLLGGPLRRDARLIQTAA
jgi:hypothetical protein